MVKRPRSAGVIKSRLVNSSRYTAMKAPCLVKLASASRGIGSDSERCEKKKAQPNSPNCNSVPFEAPGALGGEVSTKRHQQSRAQAVAQTGQNG